MHSTPIEAGRACFDPPEHSPAEQTPARELTDTKGRPLTRRRAKDMLRSAAECCELRPSRLAVLFALVHFWGRRGIYPRIDSRVAPRAKVSPSTAYECVADLCAQGLILWMHRRDEHGHNRSSLFWFTDAFFTLAGIAPTPPPYSETWSPRPPKSTHKGDPSSLSDPSSSSGSFVPSENGDHHPARAPTSASPPLPAFISIDDEPAFVDLARAHANVHATKYRPAAARHGRTYDPRDAGTIRREHRADVAAELRSLAARGLAFARDHHRDDLTADAIRHELTTRIVRDYMHQDRPWLREHGHPLGGLWATDDKSPRELRSLGLRALEAWCDALDHGEPPNLAAALDEAARRIDEAEADDARAACAELRARYDAHHPDELDELDHQEHDDNRHLDTAPIELTAPSLPERPANDTEPGPQRLTDDMRTKLAHIDADARQRHRAGRNRARRRDRVPLATRPRERLAVLVALLGCAAPAAPRDDDEHAPPEPHDDSTAAAPCPAAAPPLLRDARERPPRRAPRRRRPAPRWRQ